MREGNRSGLSLAKRCDSTIIAINVYKLLLSNCLAVRPKVQICGRSTAGIAGSNAAEEMDIRLLCLCFVGCG